MVSDKKIFYVSPYISLSKASDPWGVAIFGPRGLICTNLVDVHQVMLTNFQTKYQGCRPYGFRQEDFFVFLPIKAYVKPVTPEAGPFLAPGI